MVAATTSQQTNVIDNSTSATSTPPDHLKSRQAAMSCQQPSPRPIYWALGPTVKSNARQLTVTRIHVCVYIDHRINCGKTRRVQRVASHERSRHSECDRGSKWRWGYFVSLELDPPHRCHDQVQRVSFDPVKPLWKGVLNLVFIRHEPLGLSITRAHISDCRKDCTIATTHNHNINDENIMITTKVSLFFIIP